MSVCASKEKTTKKKKHLLESTKELEADTIKLSAEVGSGVSSAERSEGKQTSNNVVVDDLCAEDETVGVNTKQTSEKSLEGQYY